MSNLLIAAPLPVAGVTGPGTGLANLLTVDPREVWTTDGSAAPQLNVDLGAAVSFDTVFLGYVRAGRTAFTGLAIDGGAGVIGALAQPRVAGRPAHGLIALPAPVTGRNLAVTLNFGQATPATVGVLLVGLSLRPNWPQEWGSGRPVIDCGTRERLPGGGFAIDEGARKSGWQWTLGDLTESETQRLFDLALDRGETRPLIAVEDVTASAGLCERMHYCVFDKLEPYERRAIGVTRWALTVEDWL